MLACTAALPAELPTSVLAVTAVRKLDACHLHDRLGPVQGPERGVLPPLSLIGFGALAALWRGVRKVAGIGVGDQRQTRALEDISSPRCDTRTASSVTAPEDRPATHRSLH